MQSILYSGSLIRFENVVLLIIQEDKFPIIKKLGDRDNQITSLIRLKFFLCNFFFILLLKSCEKT